MRDIGKADRGRGLANARLLRAEDLLSTVDAIIYDKGAQSKSGMRLKHAPYIGGIEVEIVGDIPAPYVSSVLDHDLTVPVKDIGKKNPLGRLRILPIFGNLMSFFYLFFLLY